MPENSQPATSETPQSAAAQVDLGSGSVGRLLLKLSVPAIVAQLINVLYNIVDRMYIGHLPEVGTAALTGVGVCFPIITAVSAFAALVAMGGAPRASIFLGKGDKAAAEKILGNCTTALVGIAVVLTLALLIFGKRLLLVFGASEATIGYAWSYLRVYLLGTIFVQLALGLNAFINAQGYTRVGMVTVVIGAVLNILLDPLFLFVFKMGVAGAALATILSQAVSALFVVRFLCSGKSYLRLRAAALRPAAKVLLPCLALGASPFVMQLTESVIQVCFNTQLQRFGGDIAVGAMTILASVMQFAMLPLSGLTQGAQPISSFNFGAGKLDRVAKLFKLLLGCCLCYSTTLWAVAVFAPGVFAGIFTQNGELFDYTARVMRVYMFGAGLFGAQIACQQTFVALGKAGVSLFLAVLRKIVLLVPLIFILPGVMPDKTIAVFMAEPVADILAVLTTATLFAVIFTRMMKAWRAGQRNESDTAQC